MHLLCIKFKFKFKTGFSGQVLCSSQKAGHSEGLQGPWGDGGPGDKGAVTWPEADHWAHEWTLGVTQLAGRKVEVTGLYSTDKVHNLKDHA